MMLGFIAALALSAAPATAKAPPAEGGGATVNVILVHGAFADGSGWSKVLPKLEAKGYHALAVQLPETSLAEDVAATQRMVATTHGPVVLVGHSYGGVVITAVAAQEPRVKSLVYVSALAPDTGEPGNMYLGKYPTSGAGNIQPQTGDYLWLNPAKFHESFCQDLSAEEAKVLAASQKPIHKAAFAEKLPGGKAAWHTLPSWFVLTTDDRMVAPELQRFEAKRMNSTVVEVKASHTPFLSQPDSVVKAIVAAAGAPSKS